MNITKRAVIYHRSGSSDEENKMVYNYKGRQTIVVGVASEEATIKVAKKLVEEGVQVIELCCGMGVEWQAKVIEATGGKVPVGAILYGIESLISAADYNARFNAGQGPFIEAFITLHDGATPAVDRRVIADSLGQTTFYGVSNEAEAVKVAEELSKSNTQLIELYGGFIPASAAKVIKASGNGKIPVGVNAFSLSV